MQMPIVAQLAVAWQGDVLYIYIVEVRCQFLMHTGKAKISIVNQHIDRRQRMLLVWKTF